MNTNELLQRWSTMSLNDIEDQIIRGEDQETVAQLIGADTIAEIRGISFGAPPSSELENVVLLPGIMGSLLSSIRGVTSQLWINPLLFLQGNGRYLRLNADGDDDEYPEVDCVPIGLEKMTYLKIGLQFNRQTRLYEFPYDWRRRIEYNADILKTSIDRWSNGHPECQFTLVAHSMGGLVSRTFIARHPQHAARHVKRLIMHGTPNFGAANAIENLVNGNSMMATVDKLNSNNEMRKLVYCLPSVYQLLPTPPEYFPQGIEYPVDFDLYDARSWRMQNIQQKYLDGARSLYKILAQSDPQIPMDVIAGGNIATMIAARLAFNQDVPELQMTTIDKGTNSGDGTVPLWSAMLPGAKVHYIQEVHRALSGNNRVIRATLDLIYSGSCSLPENLPPPKLISFDAETAAPPLPPSIQAEVLQNKIETGTAGETDLKSLYFAF